MSGEDVMAVGILAMCLSIFAFNAIMTIKEYTWEEAFIAMILIDLPISGLIFWLISLLSPWAALVWGVLAPLAIYTVCDIIDRVNFAREKKRKKERASSNYPVSQLLSDYMEERCDQEADLIQNAQQPAQIRTEPVPQPVPEPVRASPTVEKAQAPALTLAPITPPVFFLPDARKPEPVKQTLARCLKCGRRSDSAICGSCKYDNSQTGIKLLSRVEPRKLQIRK